MTLRAAGSCARAAFAVKRRGMLAGDVLAQVVPASELSLSLPRGSELYPHWDACVRDGAGLG